jgi:hypothetical protein
LLALLNPSSKVLWANDIVVTFEELELPSKCLRLHQVSIDKRVGNGMIGRNNSMIIYDRIPAKRHNVIKPSDVMQSRIYHAFQKWTNEAHIQQPDHIVAIDQVWDLVQPNEFRVRAQDPSE